MPENDNDKLFQSLERFKNGEANTDDINIISKAFDSGQIEIIPSRDSKDIRQSGGANFGEENEIRVSGTVIGTQTISGITGDQILEILKLNEKKEDSNTKIILAIFGIIAIIAVGVLGYLVVAKDQHPKEATQTAEAIATALASLDITKTQTEPTTNTPTISSPPSELPDEIDRTNPKSVAMAVLMAYQTRDVITLSGLSMPYNRELYAELAEQGESHPRYASIFTEESWRWVAVNAWDGKIGDVRYQSYDEAWIKFGEIGPDEIVVVALLWFDNQWLFEDIYSPTSQDFESASKTR